MRLLRNNIEISTSTTNVTRLSKTRSLFATYRAVYTLTVCLTSYGRTAWIECGLRASMQSKCKRQFKQIYSYYLNRVLVFNYCFWSYIFWNEHEPFPGVYDFEGQRNISHFLELAQKVGLNVLLRAGPFVCAEHEYGALPWWLLSDGIETVRPRTSEENYMNAVRRWLQILLPTLASYLHENGGPILTVQVSFFFNSIFL